MREAATDYNFAEFWIVMNKLLLIFTFPMALVAGIFGLTLGIFFVILKLLKRFNNTRPRESAERKKRNSWRHSSHFTWVYIKSRWTSIGITISPELEHLFRQLRLKANQEKSKA